MLFISLIVHGAPQIIHFFHFNCVLHLFQVVETLKSFISFISIVFFIFLRVQEPSNHSFLLFQLCFSFVSGCGDLQIFHFFHFTCVFHLFQGAATFKSFFNCVFHSFQGVGTLKSFISFILTVFFICFRVWGPSNLPFLSF